MIHGPFVSVFQTFLFFSIEPWHHRVFDPFFKWTTRFIISVSFPYFHPLTCQPLLLPLSVGIAQYSCQLEGWILLCLSIVSTLESRIVGR